MQPTIELLALGLIPTVGKEWRFMHHALRSYVHSLSDAEFEKEVKQVTSPKALRMLFSVGLSSQRQAACYIRERELK